MMVEDIKVEAAVNTFRPLLKGLQYVVFASYRAHVRSFVSEDSWGTFSIVGRHFVSHGNMPLSDMNLAMRRTDSDAFIKALKDGWAFC